MYIWQPESGLVAQVCWLCLLANGTLAPSLHSSNELWELLQWVRSDSASADHFVHLYIILTYLNNHICGSCCCCYSCYYYTQRDSLVSILAEQFFTNITSKPINSLADVPLQPRHNGRFFPARLATTDIQHLQLLQCIGRASHITASMSLYNCRWQHHQPAINGNNVITGAHSFPNWLN